MPTPRTIGSKEVHAAIERLAAAIVDRHPDPSRLLILGIANGGIPVAHRLAQLLGARRVGDLDISFHRDDLGCHPAPETYTPSLVPGSVEGADVCLVDDVLFTGRTIKAALDELFDHGRPAWVRLAVLVDRGCRRLPVTADYVGMVLDVGDNEDVRVEMDQGDPSNDRIRIRPLPVRPLRPTASK